MEKEEAMKILKDFHDKSALFSVRTALETLHPELTESEDEKIRKWIINEIKIKHHNLDEDNVDFVDKAIAWLENIPYTIDHEKREGFHLGYKAALEKQGESYTKKDVDDAYVEGMAFAKNELEKQGEQKPAWSEEDENTIKVLMNIIKKSEIIDSIIYTDSLKEKLYDWLKSLRPQPKQEWSEEDEKKMESIIGSIRFNSYMHNSLAPIYEGDICWLKSLKDRVQPKTTWKPSEEQMDALNSARWNGPFKIEILDSLYNDLKKLTE